VVKRYVMPRAGVRLGAVLAALAFVLAGFGAVPASAAGTDCPGFTGAQPPGTGNSSTSPTDVAVITTCNVWVTQGDHFEHWTGGSAWTSVPVPGSNPVILNGISAISATDIWAVGQETQGSTLVPLTLHWDGASWSRKASPAVAGNATLESVRASRLATSGPWAGPSSPAPPPS
jgi:hypothetical protein